MSDHNMFPALIACSISLVLGTRIGLRTRLQSRGSFQLAWCAGQQDPSLTCLVEGVIVEVVVVLPPGPVHTGVGEEGHNGQDGYHHWQHGGEQTSRELWHETSVIVCALHL